MTELKKGDLCRIHCAESLFNNYIVEVRQSPTIPYKGVFVNGEFIKTVLCRIVFGDHYNNDHVIVRTHHLEKLETPNDGI